MDRTSSRMTIPTSNHSTAPTIGEATMTDHSSVDATETPLRIWGLQCPFRKSGSPVLGTMGSQWKTVIVIEADVWRQLCERVPALQTMQFEVGSYE